MKPNISEEDKNRKDIVTADQSITINVPITSEIKIIKNITFIEDTNSVRIYKLDVSSKDINTPEIVTLSTGEYQAAYLQEHVLVVYKNNTALTVYDLTGNKTMKTMEIGQDFSILKINSETYSNYVITVQGTNLVTYELTGIESAHENEEDHQDDGNENKGGPLVRKTDIQDINIV